MIFEIGRFLWLDNRLAVSLKIMIEFIEEN